MIASLNQAPDVTVPATCPRSYAMFEKWDTSVRRDPWLSDRRPSLSPIEKRRRRILYALAHEIEKWKERLIALDEHRFKVEFGKDDVQFINVTSGTVRCVPARASGYAHCSGEGDFGNQRNHCARRAVRGAHLGRVDESRAFARAGPIIGRLERPVDLRRRAARRRATRRRGVQDDDIDLGNTDTVTQRIQLHPSGR